MQQLRRLTALIAVALALGGCVVHESTRGGGLVPPKDTTAAADPSLGTVATVALSDGVSDDVLGTLESPSETSRAAGSPQTAVSGATAATEGNEVSSQAVASAVSQPATTDVDSLAYFRDVLATATPPEGFGEGVLGVTGPAGTQLWPVIIADTPQARQRGLMGVTDFAALGGYAAMVFIFEGDTSGAFWMRDTPLPLRITFVTAGGSVVSATDMVPCLAPTPSADCERYHPDGPYRIAIEHPVGPAFDLGLADAELVEVTVE